MTPPIGAFKAGILGAAGGGEPPVLTDEIANAKSALFDGSGDFYAAPDTALGTYNFTLMAWIRVATGGGHETIIDATTSPLGAFQGYHFRWGSAVSGDAKLRFIPYYVAYPLANYLVDSTDTLAVDTWGLATATYDNATTTAKVYINDGTPATNTGISLYDLPNGTYCHIGSMSNATSPFGGHIDDCAYWNTALSAAEIARIYDLKASGELANLNVDSGDYASAANLVAWWRMGDNGTDRSAVKNMATGAASAGTGADCAQATASKQPTFTTEIPS